jgi:hypothetical protein
MNFPSLELNQSKGHKGKSVAVKLTVKFKSRGDNYKYSISKCVQEAPPDKCKEF